MVAKQNLVGLRKNLLVLFEDITIEILWCNSYESYTFLFRILIFHFSAVEFFKDLFDQANALDRIDDIAIELGDSLSVFNGSQ